MVTISVLIDRNDIICWRRDFLRQIQEFRRKNRKIYYTDETLVNVGIVTRKMWFDNFVTSAKIAFLRRHLTGLNQMSGAGEPKHKRSAAFGLFL